MKPEREIYLLFAWSILLKGAISFFEVLIGVIVLLVPVSTIISFSELITSENNTHTNFILNHVLPAIHILTTIGTLYIGLYLISRGAIKLGLIVALLKNKLWAYPWSLLVLGMFMIFQVYEIIKIHSLAIIAVTLFDCVVMYSIWREWQIIKNKNRN